MHQKCFSFALTNLLFGLCKSMSIIDLLIIHPSLHPRATTRPSTPKVLRTRECSPTPCPSTIFTFGLAIEFIQEFGDASNKVTLKTRLQLCKNLWCFKKRMFAKLGINLKSWGFLSQFTWVTSLKAKEGVGFNHIKIKGIKSIKSQWYKPNQKFNLWLNSVLM
jgi:hypothetical protein